MGVGGCSVAGNLKFYMNLLTIVRKFYYFTIESPLGVLHFDFLNSKPGCLTGVSHTTRGSLGTGALMLGHSRPAVRLRTSEASVQALPLKRAEVRRFSIHVIRKSFPKSCSLNWRGRCSSIPGQLHLEPRETHMNKGSCSALKAQSLGDSRNQTL